MTSMTGSASPAIGTEPAAGFVGYLRRHWHGEHSLRLSFWGNFVAVTVAARLLFGVLGERLADSGWPMFALAATLFAVVWLLVFPWQLVGVVRSARRAVAGFDYGALGLLAPLVVGLSVFTALPQVLVLGQWLAGPPSLPPAYAPRAPDYALELSADGRLVRVSGFLDFGVTRDLRELLLGNPDLVAVVLDSEGGQVYEGRALAKMIRAHGLDTFSLAGCSSACATAFIGGRHRWLAPGARLGFHQYRLDGSYMHPLVDISAEQRTDIAFFASQAIAGDFLGRVFEQPYSGIWYPSSEELLAARVIDGLLDATAAAALRVRLPGCTPLECRPSPRDG